LIPKDTIQTIIETARIEEVVGEFVHLRKRGVNYVGLCPFHNEKTPSFTVSPAKGIYKCFGCGKAGNSVNFIMEHEHYTYPEALKFLAKKYNIEVEEEQQTPEQIQQLNERESLYAVTEFARKFFTEQLLNTDEGKSIGLSYFKERDFTDKTIDEFQLGYSPDRWDAFTKAAKENGYEKQFLVKTGLTIDKDGKHFDRFRARVIFPIHNLTGRVIGFGGRILKKDDKKAKYVNSPESEIYNKSKVLYGIYFAKNEIIKKDNCFLVEGYTDVISLFQAGIKNVVASSGTSLTTGQIRLIKRYTPNITILYDGDAAGLKASFRGIDMILEQGMNVKVVLFPEGEDPDSYARTHRSVEVEDYITSQAKDFIRFKTSVLLEETQNDPVKKAGLIKEIVQTISLIPDGITRSLYVKECSALLDMTEQTLMNELNKRLRENFKKKSRSTPPETMTPEVQEYQQEKQTEFDVYETEYQERDIIRILLNYGQQEIIFEETDENGHPVEIAVEVAKFIVNDIRRDSLEFKDPAFKKIFDEYVQHIERDEIPDENHFKNHEDPEISTLAVNMLLSPYELSENWQKLAKIEVVTESGKLKKAVVNSVLSFKAKMIEKLIFDNQEKLKETENDEDIVILLKEQQKLKNISRLINKELGRIVTK
jgi:DNA primase